MDKFNIRVHGLKYLQMRHVLNLRFSVTWEFLQDGTDLRLSDTVAGNLAWIDKVSGEIQWTPHLSRMGRKSVCFHTISPDFDILIQETLMSSSFMEPLVKEYHEQKEETEEDLFLPTQPSTEVELKAR